MRKLEEMTDEQLALAYVGATIGHSICYCLATR